MSTTQPSNPSASNPSVSLVQGMVNAIWPYMSGRRGLIVLAIGIAAGGMAMNWGWLVAVGAAPILLAVLPCAAMCGLGLCMNKAGGKSCSSDNKKLGEGSDFKEGPDGDAQRRGADSSTLKRRRNTMIRTLTIIIVAGGVGMGSAFAHQQGPKQHLAEAPLDQQVDALTFCDGVYRVGTKEGSPIDFPEFDLRFKTDSSEDGPVPGTPVVINAGMRGNRGFVIFSAPGEISDFIETKC